MAARSSRTSARPSPLAVSAAFRAFVLDQLADFGEVQSRAMFGGVGLYRRGTFFGILAGDVLYLRADVDTRGEYEAAGMKPFKPYRDRPTTMKYYSVPLAVLESPPELTAWARRAVAAAERASASVSGPSTPAARRRGHGRNTRSGARRGGA